MLGTTEPEFTYPNKVNIQAPASTLALHVLQQGADAGHGLVILLYHEINNTL